jgi:hypothetical protein
MLEQSDGPDVTELRMVVNVSVAPALAGTAARAANAVNRASFVFKVSLPIRATAGDAGKRHCQRQIFS